MKEGVTTWIATKTSVKCILMFVHEMTLSGRSWQAIVKITVSTLDFYGSRHKSEMKVKAPRFTYERMG